MSGKVAIIVGSEQKGLYTSLGIQLSDCCEVLYLADSKDGSNVIKRICKPWEPLVQLIPNFRLKPSPLQDTIRRATDKENQYGITYSEIISSDRGLGRGYLGNVDGYPWIKRANWTFEEKLECINKQFDFYENVQNGVSLLISQYPQLIPSLVCEHRSIGHVHLLQARYGERMVWSDGSRFMSANYRDELSKNLAELHSSNLESFNTKSHYQVDVPGAKLIKEQERFFSLKGTTQLIIRQLYARSLRLVLGRWKQNSYTPFSWLRVLASRYIHYKYITKNSVHPNQFCDGGIVYFPLQMEPEIGMLQFSREFSNVFEAVSWTSRALPSDKTLIVKENPRVFGHRNKFFYKKLIAMGNVRFSAPNVSSDKWISKSSFVVTISGTVGEEAVYHKKPLMTFGRHNIVNSLPSVSVVATYEQVRDATDRILKQQVTERELRVSELALRKTLFSLSFELEGYSSNYDSDSLDERRSRIAIDELVRLHPRLLSKN